jgi:hypothetical protein
LVFEEGKNLATQKAKETCAGTRLLSWYQGKTCDSYPDQQRGTGDKPTSILYVESRSSDLTIEINEGQSVFI